MAAARKQPEPVPTEPEAQEFRISVGDIEDIIQSLNSVEVEACSYGVLKSAVIEYEDYLAVYENYEWTLRQKGSV